MSRRMPHMTPRQGRAWQDVGMLELAANRRRGQVRRESWGQALPLHLANFSHRGSAEGSRVEHTDVTLGQIVGGLFPRTRPTRPQFEVSLVIRCASLRGTPHLPSAVAARSLR